jgi:(2Fe-2S) ferredoxin
MTDQPHTFAICVNRRLGADKPSCAARGSELIADAMEAGIRARAIPVTLERLVCFGLCMDGPNARLIPGGAFHKGIKKEDVPALLDKLVQVCSTDGVKITDLDKIIPDPGS